MTDLEKDILDILESHIGFENKINQYLLTDRLFWETNNHFACRKVRSTIENLITQGYPIISTPKNGGGYCLQKTNQEGLECYKRIQRQAVKLFLKARKIRANSRMGQMDLDIRF